MTLVLSEKSEAAKGGHSFPPEALCLYLGPRQKTKDTPVEQPEVPWQDLDPGKTIRTPTLLNWPGRISRFTGRDSEIKALEQWALNPAPLSIQWLTGTGGTGKSRLAAEFCDHLNEHHRWACGFTDLARPRAFVLEQEGLLLAIENPEHNKEGVRELFQELAGLDQDKLVEAGKKIRFLFLSRQTFEEWQPLIFETGVEALVHRFPIELAALSFNSAEKVFYSGFSKTAELQAIQGLAPDEEQAESWLRPETDNRRPHLILAAAVYHALYPEEHLALFGGHEIVGQLVRRDMAEAEKIASEAGLDEPLIFAILQFIATVRGPLDAEAVDKLMPLIFSGENKCPEGKDFLSRYLAAGFLQQKQISPLEPELFAAAYAMELLQRTQTFAPKLIRLSLGSDFSRSLPRLSRLCHDAEREFDFDRYRFDQCLAQEITDSPDQSAALEPFLNTELYGLNETGARACRSCLQQTASESGKMRLFAKISRFLFTLGDKKEALRQRIFAVDICEKLAAGEPDRYEAELAGNYFDLWKILFAMGERGKAYRVIEKTAELYEKLATQEPRPFKLLLAEVLKILGTVYAEAGEWEKALSETEKALKIYEQLAAIQPLAFASILGACHLSQGDYCARLERTEKALTAALKAVSIYERLDTVWPDRFQGGLAASLTSLGNAYIATGERAEALKTIQRALEIYENLTARQPEKFEAELAGSLNIAANLHAYFDDEDKALEITERVVSIYSKLANKTALYDSLLASSLNNLSSRYTNIGKDKKALLAIDTAVKIYENLSSSYPLVFDPHLATSLNRLGLGYASMGDYKRALVAIGEAVEIYSKLAAEQPEYFEPELAGSLNNQGILYAKTGDPEKALVATEMAVNIKEQLASADPEKYVPSLVKSLRELEQRYCDVGEEEKGRIIRRRAEELQEKYLEAVD